jgi:flagellin
MNAQQLNSNTQKEIGSSLEKLASAGDLGSAIGTVALASAGDATALMTAVDTALDTLNTKRSALGAGQLQLESSVRTNQVSVVSLQNAESVIRDTDYAAESANFNKLNIVSQAGMYAISQANSSQQNIMKLLQ